MTKYFVIIITVLLILLRLSVSNTIKMTKDRDRLQHNQEILQSDIERYKTDDSINVASVRALTMTAAELRSANHALLADLDKVNIKVKRLESAAKTATVNNTKVVTIYDTIRQAFNYNDNYVTLTGSINSDTITANLSIRDTLTTFLYREPKRFLGIPFGTKYIRQEVFNSNPNVIIDYTEYIKIKR
ncbi:MAG: DUF6549 family protein [Marinifilaceae bacterium]